MSRPALLDKLFQAGEWLLKPSLVPVDDVTIKRNQTAVYVALDALIRQGGGLAVGQDKRIYVDFSLMPTDAFEELLKSIRVPVWLTKNLTIYVATTGSDMLDEGRGLTQDKPFATLQAALNYAADTYNISSYHVTINVAAGNYVVPGKYITLPQYNAGTGEIQIVGASADYSQTVIGGIRSVFSSTYTFRNLTIKNDMTATGAAVWSMLVEDGDISLYNVALDSTEITSSGIITALLAQGGRVQILGTTGDPCGLHIKPQANQTYLVRCGNAYIGVTADIIVDSEVTVSGAALDVQELGIFSISQSVSATTPGRYPLFSGPVTGKRYTCSGNAVINTRGAGPDVIPGTIAGTLSNGGQYI
ncbi:hypothetical protein [Mailhella massiliensis]|uniref:hypothetical protein n=1 Tax=Mailhella massiliensis TaxID=1903261 RepID=UPI0023EF70FF|nr:hypothetical protein [Mailhella massiliensis]